MKTKLRTQSPYIKLTDEQKGSLRRWDVEPTPLPPHPCMLCSGAYATAAQLETHIRCSHGGLSEYRKRLFFLASQADAVGKVNPQLWRHIVEAFSEEFVTGEQDWPECGHVDGDDGPRR